MQLLDKTPRLSARAAAAVLVLSVVILLATCAVGYNFALAAGPEDSQTSGASQPNLSGVWTGQIKERGPDGAIKGRSSLYLRIQQSGEQIIGIIGDTEQTTSSMENVALSGNHLKFSAKAPGGPKGPVTWAVELDVNGDVMEGQGRAFRSADNHGWGGEIKLSRNK